MKIEIDGVIYEGSPDELREFFPDLAKTRLPDVRQTQRVANQSASVKEFMRRVLRRLPIPDGQIALYQALYHAPSGLSYSALAESMQRAENELAGVLGALGRRVNNTEGSTGDLGITVLFDIERDSERWHYQMKDDLRRVLEEENFDWL